MQPSSIPDPRSGAGPDAAAFFRLLLETQDDAVVVADAHGVVLYATPAADQVLRARVIAGSRLLDLVGEDARPDAARALAPPGELGPDSGTWQLPDHDGQPAYVDFRVSDLRDEPAVAGVVLIMRDVTERRRSEEDLRRRAFHDPLTGLANRALFDERAGRALARARRERRLVAVMLGDLDGFKAVNDTLGHRAGDELLAAVAGRLTGAVRTTDLAARFGGDEFAFLIDGLTEPEGAAVFARRVVDAVAAQFSLASGPAEIGISVGVTVSDGSGADVAGLVDQADRALYAAKAAGRRTWRQHAAEMPGAPRSPVAGTGGVSAMGFPALLSRLRPWRCDARVPNAPGRPVVAGVRPGRRRP